ncbi:MAG: hypothetical protein ACREX0_07500, partial [Noviherbaspirillum sp.]
MMDRIRHSRTRKLFFPAALLAASLHAQAAPVTLPAYNVDVSQTSVSGLSSGGFMALQLHVAF